MAEPACQEHEEASLPRVELRLFDVPRSGEELLAKEQALLQELLLCPEDVLDESRSQGQWPLWYYREALCPGISSIILRRSVLGTSTGAIPAESARDAGAPGSAKIGARCGALMRPARGRGGLPGDGARVRVSPAELAAG